MADAAGDESDEEVDGDLSDMEIHQPFDEPDVLYQEKPDPLT